MSGSKSASQPVVSLTFSPPNQLGFILDTLEVEEELGRPFLITLDVSSEKPQGDLHLLLGGSATVSLTYPQRTERYFNGIVARVNYRGLASGAYRYRIELRPWIWLLDHQADCRIFSAQSPWTIMTTLFRDAGFTDFSDKRQNASGDTSLDYCVQYRETTFAFVTRLMEQFGIYYYATHTNGTHTLVFADDPNSHTAAAKSIPYHYEQTDWRTVGDHLWSFSADAVIRPGAYTLREYNFTTPKADLTAKSLIPGQHTHGSDEVYDYPGLYDLANSGQTLAQIRMQGLDASRQTYAGISNSRSLGTGTKFTLSNFPDSAANQEYLIISSVITVERAETRATQDEDAILDTFRCEFRAVPGSKTFRLAPLTPRPVIRGPQTAVVAGEQGQEVTTDLYGRIKVKFPWDRRTTQDENSSCWIRVAQIWAGQSWGAMFIPRIGQEVVVEFLEGNPDRPLVTGRVYNADQTVPYTLPDNKTRSTIKSNSSMGGGGFNEFRFEDKKDSEEVFLQAQKDYNITVLNNYTSTVTQDSTTTVQKGNRAVTISQGNESLTVSQGNRTLTISQGNDSKTVSKGDHSLTVSTGNDSTTVSTGNRSTTVSQGNDTHTVSLGDHKITVTAGSSTIEAGTKITLKVGVNSLEISQSGVTINGTEVKLSGTATFEASAPSSKLSGTATVEVSGATAKVAGDAELQLQGGGMATLKGGVVMIN